MFSFRTSDNLYIVFRTSGQLTGCSEEQGRKRTNPREKCLNFERFRFFRSEVPQSYSYFFLVNNSEKTLNIPTKIRLILENSL